MICGWIINIVKSILFCFVLFYNAINVRFNEKGGKIGMHLGESSNERMNGKVGMYLFEGKF